MSTVINTNMFSINALREMNLIERTEEKAMERISSGMRINQAADDAAGIALLQKANAQITGYTQTVRNSNDAITMSQVADSAMGDIGNVLQRMRELSLQSTSSSYSDDDRESMQVEFKVLQEQIKGVINNTVFNGIPVLNRPEGQQTNTIDLQVGGNFTDLTEHNAMEGVAVDTAIRGYYTGVGLYQNPGSEVEYTLAAGDDRSFEVEIDGIASGVIDLAAGTKTTTEWAALMQQQVNADPTLADDEKSISVSYDETVNRFVFLSDSKDEAVSSVKMSNGIFGLGLTTTPSASSGQSEVISLLGLPESERQLNFAVDGANPTTYTVPEYVKPAVEWGFYLDDLLDDADVTFDADSQQFMIASKAGESGAIAQGTRGGIASLGLVVHDTSKVSLNHYDMDDPADSLGSILQISEMINTQQLGEEMLTKIDTALQSVDQRRAHFGAVQNRLVSVASYLETARVDSSDVRSRIEDADFAAESAQLARAGIMKQVTTAMMAQANQLPEQMLQMFA